MMLPEGLAADVLEIKTLLQRIAVAVENLDGNYDEGGGVVAVLNTENIRDVLKGLPPIKIGLPA